MIKAIIFDMDGVISDTQLTHCKVISDILREFGINKTPEEISKRYAGIRYVELFKIELTGKTYDLEKIVEKARKNMLTQPIQEVKGATKLIKQMHKKEFFIGLASSSNSKFVNKVLEGLNIKQYFKAIIGGDMVQKGKPNPEIFLLAAKRLGIEPEKCLVIEDGRAGMAAAKEANMVCIGLVENKKDNYPTKNLVETLNEITIEYIKKLDD